MQPVREFQVPPVRANTPIANRWGIAAAGVLDAGCPGRDLRLERFQNAADQTVRLEYFGRDADFHDCDLRRSDLQHFLAVCG